MKHRVHTPYGVVRTSHFPPSVFGAIFFGLLLASGIHMGLLTIMREGNADERIQTLLPIIYWSIVSVMVTLFNVSATRRTYERPLQAVALAARKVASGDFSIYVSPIHSANKLDYLDVMILDFNKMVAELGSIETLKNDFAANVSHELKTPLAVIQNYTDLLQRTDLTPEQHTYLTAIHDGAHRLSTLISNMLKLNKLESQKIRPQPQQYDLCQQLTSCVIGFESIWEKKGLELEADLEDMVTIEADKSLLEMVWNNLLSNAIKFTEPGGTITLVQTSSDSEVTVTISDTGCGMAPDTVAHIFDKFYQGDTSHATEGNGLGLALVQRILQLSDGSISVKSTLGEGTSFTVHLPIQIKAEEQEKDYGQETAE